MMSIRVKLLAGFAVVLSVLLFLSVITYNRLESVEHLFTEYIEKDVKLLDTAQDIQITHALSESAFKSYLLVGDPMHLEEYKSLDGETDRYIDELEKLAYKGETRQLVEQIKAAMDAYDVYTDHILTLRQDGQPGDYLKYMHENKKVSGDFNEAINNLVKFQDNNSIQMKKIVADKADQTNKIVIALSVIALLLGLSTALLMGKMIALPLKNIAREAGRISDGDLSGSDLPVNSKDELGVLAASFNQMRFNIKEMVQGITDVAAKVTHAAGNLSRQAGQTAAGASENASAIGEISASADQMSQHTQKVAEVAGDTAQKAEAGAQGINQATQQMEIITTSSNQASRVLNELAGTMEQINQIIELITHISEQTNLLALNAAIEAARAGDQGRGFAVVAEEVRKLAVQSSEAAEEIKTLIRDVQDGSKRAVVAMNEGDARVREGAVVINEVGGKFQDIIAAIAGLSGQVQDLAAASQQISAGVQNVAATTEEQTAAMEEVSAATEELTQMARELEIMAGRFKI